MEQQIPKVFTITFTYESNSYNSNERTLQQTTSDRIALNFFAMSIKELLDNFTNSVIGTKIPKEFVFIIIEENVTETEKLIKKGFFSPERSTCNDKLTEIGRGRLNELLAKYPITDE